MASEAAPEGVARPVPPTVGKPPLGRLISQVAADAGGLVLDEARLARAETADNFTHLGRAVGLAATGGLLLALALVFAVSAAVVALAMALGLLAALLLVAIGALLLGWLLLAIGKRRVARAKLLPERTLSRIANDLARLADGTDKLEDRPQNIASPLANGQDRNI